jgi:hypothetical protein
LWRDIRKTIDGKRTARNTSTARFFEDQPGTAAIAVDSFQYKSYSSRLNGGRGNWTLFYEMPVNVDALSLRWRSEFEAMESTIRAVNKALSASLLGIKDHVGQPWRSDDASPRSRGCGGGRCELALWMAMRISIV